LLRAKTFTFISGRTDLSGASALIVSGGFSVYFAACETESRKPKIEYPAEAPVFYSYETMLSIPRITGMKSKFESPMVRFKNHKSAFPPPQLAYFR
jgi:hypothetical protein